MPSYDVAVVGLGAMGSAALYAAAGRGQRVIGFDRFEPAHSTSSSFGESRVIRLAYFEDPSYVPLLRGAYRAWREFEAASGEKILTITGIIEAGDPGAALVEGSIRSAQEHDLSHELLSPQQVNLRFPAFNLPASWTCVFQPDGGVLLAEKAVGLFVSTARVLGATVRLNAPVLDVQPAGDGIKLRLGSGEVIEASSAIVAPGPWIRDLMPGLGGHLKLTRQPLLWFNPVDEVLTRPDRMPVFFFQSDGHLTYGLPNICGSGVKAASHLSGGDLVSADESRAKVSDDEKASLRAILQRYVPAAAGEASRTSLCVYTRSPDEHFVLGLHPEAPQIVLASPCSGHGFKFASIIGEILADLAIDRNTRWPIGRFKPDRVLSGAKFLQSGSFTD